MRTLPFRGCWLAAILLAAFICSASAEDVTYVDVNERLVDGGRYALSVYTADGTAAHDVPAKLRAAAAAKGKSGVKGGGGADTGMPGFNRILYIRVNFPDDSREYVTQTEANTDCRDVADFFAENSYGLWQLEFDVTPLLTMPQGFMHYREITAHPSIQYGVPPLMADAYQAAVDAGYSGTYGAIVVAHRPMFPASSSNIQLNGAGAATLAHEVGHTYGADHSDRWLNDGISPYGTRDWRKFGNGTPNANNQGRIINIYEMSCFPYGDPYCNMGGGGLGHWSMYWKYALGLIPASNMATVTTSGRFRITAYDQPHLEQGRLYALYINKNNQQNYILSYRSRQYDGRAIEFAQGTHPWLTDSLLVQGTPWDSSMEKNMLGSSASPTPHLIDTTPGSAKSLTDATSFIVTDLPVDPDNIADGGLALGRTYSDLHAEVPIHVTVVDKVRSEPQALDVVVNLGAFPQNRPPTLTLRTAVGKSGQALVPLVTGAQQTDVAMFYATASDPDGDQLAYSWDFGDCRNPTTSASITEPWVNTNVPALGHYWLAADVGTGRLVTVRCTVSDMKGGTATAYIKVNLGLPEFTGPGSNGGRTKLWASGRVVDQDGYPMSGVRVAWVGTPYLGSFTDSNGYYSVPNLQGNTNHQFDLTMEGYRFIGVNEAASQTVMFTSEDLNHVDFVGYRRQTVAVTAVSPTVAAGQRPVWQVTRSVPATGTFQKPADYTQPVDFLTIKPLVVRLYSDAGSLESSADGGATWTAVPVFSDINLETPENPTQYRRESKSTAVLNVPDANPTQDLDIRFNSGQTSILVRGMATTMPDGSSHYVNTYSILAAIGVDYVAQPEQASVRVEAVQPATPTLTLRADTGYASEDGSYIAQYSVVSDIATPDRLTVPITYTPGTADLADLTNPPTTVVLEPGQTEAAFQIRAADDRIREDIETLQVGIDTGAGYALGATTDQSLTIFDNDTPRVNVTMLNGPAREANEYNTGPVSGIFSIRRIGNIEQDLVVGLATSGTATSGHDYIALPPTVTIPAGRASVEVPLTPIADSLIEGDETVVLSVVPRLDYQVNNPGSATMVIQDAQRPDVGVALVGSGTIYENGGTGTVTLRFTRYRASTTAALPVTFSLTGTASYGLDYQITNMPSRGLVTIPSGQSYVDCDLNASNDLIREIKDVQGTKQEDNEYVFVRILPTSSYNVIPKKDSVSVTIIDDETATDPATIAWEMPTTTVREGRAVSVDLVLSDWPTQPIDFSASDPLLYAKVDWAVVADSTGAHPAVLGVDVPAASGTATLTRTQLFSQTPRHYTVTIPIPDNATAQPDRTFKLVLSNPQPTSGAAKVSLPMVQFGSDNLAECLVTILDDDQGTVDVSLDQTSVTEGGVVNLTITRTPAGTSGVLPVAIEMSGTAVPGVHFSQFGSDTWVDGDSSQLRTVTLAAGQNSLTIPITTFDNLTDETDRVVNFGVSIAPGYQFGSVVSLTILNNDTDTRPIVTITATDPFASEAGPKSGIITVTRSSTVGSLTVPLVISSASTASPSRYLPIPTSVSFAAGQASKTFNVTPIDDTLVEDTQTVIVALVADSSTFYQPGEPSAATVWIADNDGAKPVVRVDAIIDRVDEEGAVSGHVGRFLVRRTKEDRGPLTVDVAITGTATQGVDYQTLGAVIIPAGQTSVAVDVVPLSDALVEGDETVVMTLSANPSYIIEPTATAATVTIVDDEASSVSIEATQDGMEAGPVPVEYTLTRSGGDLAATLDVVVNLSGGTDDPATPGTDTTVSVVTAHFAAGDVTTTVSVPVVDDALSEADEALVGTVGSGAGYVAGSPATAEAGIFDNDRPRIFLAITSTPLNADGTFDINESGAPTSATLTVSCDTPLASPLTVTYSLGGTASQGSDYVDAQLGTVTLPAGATPSATINITSIDDVLIESPETIIVTLDPSLTSAYNLGDDTVTVNVLSDDGVRVAVVGPPNFQIGTFCGPLVYRFYRLGGTLGGLRVNYSVVPDTDPATTDLANDGTAFTALNGYFDFFDGQSTYDLTIPILPSYVANARRNLTIQVDMPNIVGSYQPGTVPGVPGGLVSATCRILASTDGNLVKLTGVDTVATEGGLDTATVRVTATPTVGWTCPLSALAGLTTAQPGSDYSLAGSVTIPVGSQSADAVLTAPKDFLVIEGTEYAMIMLTLPPETPPIDPAYFVVGLPVQIQIIDAPPPKPDIAVYKGLVSIPNNGYDSQPGRLAYGVPVLFSYTLHNDGDLPLTVGALSVGTLINAGVVLDTSLVPAVLPAGSTAVFTATVTPTTNGLWQVPLSWASNDPDESPFTFVILGSAAATASQAGVVTNPNGTGDNGLCGAGGSVGLLLASLGLIGLSRRRRR